MIRDVARHAGLTAGCVSNMINGRRRQDEPIGHAVLHDNEPPDWVFSLSDTATLAVYGLIRERGLGPGTATALVAFDDSA